MCCWTRGTLFWLLGFWNNRLSENHCMALTSSLGGLCGSIITSHYCLPLLPVDRTHNYNRGYRALSLWRKHMTFFGPSLKRRMESFFFGGDSVTVWPWWRDFTCVIFTLHHLYFWGSLFWWWKRGGGGVFFFLCLLSPWSLSRLALLLQSVSNVKSLLSKIELQSPGEWMLKWRHVIAVPYQWLTEACVPRPVTALSLSLAGPVGSTTPHHLGFVNTSSEKNK